MTEYVLEILDGDRAGDIIELGNPPVTLGRRPSNDVPLRDEKVSGEHAAIVQEDGQWVLRDLGSTNGTLMEGRRVEEIGLTANDIFQLGRVHIAFKEKGAPTPKVGGELAVRTLDREQLARTRKGGGVGLLLVLVLLLGGGAGYWFFLRDGGDTGGAGRRVKPPLRIAGNMLSAGSDMEEEGGWDLAASGLAFAHERSRAGAHTGTGYLVVRRDAAAPARFALARTTKDQIVSVGGGVRAVAWLRTAGAARAALRLRFWSTRSADVLTTGTPPAQFAKYTEVSCVTGVPPGCDRVAVEVLALLPDGGEAAPEVAVDDVALLNEADAPAHDIQTSAGQRVAGTGGALIVRDVTSTVLSGVLPVTEDPGLRELQKAGLLTLSDAGRTLQVADQDGGVSLAMAGGAGLALRFDSGLVAGGVHARAGDAPFEGYGGTFELAAADRLLLGYGTARFMVETPQPTAMRGAVSGSQFVLTLPEATSLRLVYAFGAARDKARVLLAEARRLFAAGDHRGVMDKVKEALARYPHDDTQYKELTALRTKVRNLQADRVRYLEAELEKAVYFESLAGYRRLRTELAELTRVCGEEHLLQKDKIQAMRDKVEATIARIEAEESVAVRRKLGVLVKVYRGAGEKDMAEMIQGYIDTLPKTGDDGEDR